MKRQIKPPNACHDCYRHIYARGYCSYHYCLRRNKGEFKDKPIMFKKYQPCIIEGCGNLILSRNLCTKHYWDASKIGFKDE